MALKRAVPSERLECIFYNRYRDNIAGLILCSGITISSNLTFKCKRLVEILSDGISLLHLSKEVFRQAILAIERLNLHYNPAIGFARLIYDSCGASIEKHETRFRIFGFF